MSQIGEMSTGRPFQTDEVAWLKACHYRGHEGGSEFKLLAFPVINTALDLFLNNFISASMELVNSYPMSLFKIKHIETWHICYMFSTSLFKFQFQQHYELSLTR